jgi:hypothetical protein
MKSAYFIIHPGKNPPHQNGCRLKSVMFYIKSTSFPSSTFPIQPDFSQNQPATITLNTGLHYGGEGLRLVKNTWPRHGYMRQMVDVPEKN